MVAFQRSAEVHRTKPAWGLLTALGAAAVGVAMFAAGILTGNLLKVESPETPGLFARQNAFIALGLFVFVALKMLLPYLKREPRLPVFDTGSWKGAVTLAFVLGINVFLVGIGVGFIAEAVGHWHRVVWPMGAGMLLLGSWGIMLGRQGVEIRPRIWMIMASILLLGAAIASVIKAC